MFNTMNKKNYTAAKIVAIFLFCCAIGVGGFSQDKEKRVSLSGDWRFMLGDNMKFARPEHNDADWEQIYVPSSWQEEGFRNYNGYAWYRKVFDITFESKDELYLELGRIDDADEVYINGHFIGRTGGFPPDYFTAYNYERRYFVPQEHLKKNGKNVIAVRVYDEGGEGGIVSSPVGIYNYANFSENSVHLFGKWKFHLGDDKDWSQENLNDAGWEDIIVPSSWEAQGFGKYDGFAWYRKTFKLPENFDTDDLVIMMGRIDDMDEVFINGKFIDGTGPINREWASNGEWDRHRVYSVPEEVLKRGGNNVIAVRVYDQQGRGGIYEGPVSLLPRSEYRYFWKEYRNDNYDVFHWLSYFFD
jgi:sialate O-acetylesterase